MKAMIDVLRCHSLFILQKCFQNTGVDWGKYSRGVFHLFSFKGYTDETVEDVWVSAQPPHEPVPFAGKEDVNILNQNLELNVLNVNRFLAGGAAQWWA